MPSSGGSGGSGDHNSNSGSGGGGDGDGGQEEVGDSPGPQARSKAHPKTTAARRGSKSKSKAIVVIRKNVLKHANQHAEARVLMADCSGATAKVTVTIGAASCAELLDQTRISDIQSVMEYLIAPANFDQISSARVSHCVHIFMLHRVHVILTRFYSVIISLTF